MIEAAYLVQAWQFESVEALVCLPLFVSRICKLPPYARFYEAHYITREMGMNWRSQVSGKHQTISNSQIHCICIVVVILVIVHFGTSPFETYYYGEQGKLFISSSATLLFRVSH